MAQNWNVVSKTLRGKYIRYCLESPDPNADVDITAGADRTGAGFWNMAANQRPSRANIVDFKQAILRTDRDKMDAFGLNFKKEPYMTDEMIGTFAGDAPALTAYGNQAFYQKYGSSGGGVTTISGTDEQETGVEYEKYIRGIKEKAITTPDVYITDASAELAEIETQSLNVYKLSFAKYYNTYKMTKEDAHKKAMHDKDVYFKMLKQQYDLIYTNKIYEEASKKIFKS